MRGLRKPKKARRRMAVDARLLSKHRGRAQHRAQPEHRTWPNQRGRGQETRQHERDNRPATAQNASVSLRECRCLDRAYVEPAWRRVVFVATNCHEAQALHSAPAAYLEGIPQLERSKATQCRGQEMPSLSIEHCCLTPRLVFRDALVVFEGLEGPLPRDSRICAPHRQLVAA